MKTEHKKNLAKKLVVFGVAFFFATGLFGAMTQAQGLLGLVLFVIFISSIFVAAYGVCVLWVLEDL